MRLISLDFLGTGIQIKPGSNVTMSSAYCPSLVERVQNVKKAYGVQAQKQWDDVIRELSNDCKKMERLEKTGALEYNSELKADYDEALKYAKFINDDISSTETNLTTGGVRKSKKSKKSKQSKHKKTVKRRSAKSSKKSTKSRKH